MNYVGRAPVTGARFFFLWQTIIRRILRVQGPRGFDTSPPKVEQSCVVAEGLTLGNVQILSAPTHRQ